MFFLQAGAGTLEFHVFVMFLVFVSLLMLKSFLAIGCRPCGKAGASVHLKKSRFRLEGVELGLAAFCAHGPKTQK